MKTPLRVQMTTEDAAIVVAALRFWHDTYLEPGADDYEEGESRSGRVERRLIRALARRGFRMAIDK